LATRLGIGVSRSTLLRVIRWLPDPPVRRVRVLGVDEVALRRQPVNLLIGQEAEDSPDGYSHPGVEVITELVDRVGGAPLPPGRHTT